MNLHPIGSSEIATVVGLGRRKADSTPYQSALELWARLRGLLPRYDDEGSPDADAGTDMEPGIGLRWQAQNGGTPLVPGPKIPAPGVSVPELPWLRVRVDFLAPALRTVLECKSPRELGPEWGPFGTDQIAYYYAPQVVAQVAVYARLGLADRCELAVRCRATRDRDRAWGVFVLERDERTEGGLLRRAHDWYRRHVEDGIPPLGDGSESASRTLAALWAPEDREVQATAEDLETWHALTQTRTALDELEARRRELEQRLQARMGPATVLTDGRRRLATWRPRRGADRIDLRRLRAERPDIVSTYAETGTSGRSFTLERPR